MSKTRFRKRFLILPGILIAVILGIDHWLPYSLLSHYKIPVEAQPQSLKQYDAAKEEITFKTKDGVKIAGWLIPAKARSTEQPTLILIHGRGSNRQSLLEFALPIWQKGFNLALIDLRGHGGSEGEFFTYGYHEWQDVSGLIDDLEQRNLSKRVAVLGTSAGGVVAIAATAKDQRIRALVSVGAFAELNQTIERQSGWLPGAWREHAKGNAERMAKFRISEVAAIANIQQVRVPSLIAHGTADTYIPFEDGQQIFQSATGNKRFYGIANAVHETMLTLDRQKLQQEISDFLQESLKVI
jgi:uncharacterized protein